ncbi:MAG: DUF1775 domain-containing protein [Actinomycetota bacterium]|nr:DUF1775 domain-containing protein [Actinomycetota bacterium]
MLRRLAAVTALSVGALVVMASPAWGHVDLDPGEAVAGATETLTFSFEHGKDGRATTALIVQVPEGATVVDVPAVAGFTSAVDDDERTVTWSGGSVPDGTRARFPIVVTLPPTPGEVLFPTIQETEAGELAWISPGGGASETERPAPRLTLLTDPNATTTTTEAPATTTTRADRPGTTLEAQERDDGNTSAAPWVIGSGLVALAAIGIGGTLLKRRTG